MFNPPSSPSHSHIQYRCVVVVLIVLTTGCQRSEQPLQPEATSSQQRALAESRQGEANTDRGEREVTIELSPIQFTDVSERTGIDFLHVSGDSNEKPFPAANGSGLVACDFDLDGWNDLYFLNGRTFPLTEPSDNSGNRLFRNKKALQFADVSKNAGLDLRAYSAGAAMGDFNLDGFPDICVNCFGANHFYINQGDGSFEETAHASGLDDPAWGTSAAALDFDNDGDLDLYVCHYAEWAWESNQFCGNREKNVRIFCSPRSVMPVADRLFENLGDGTFRDALSKAKLDREPGRGQGVVAADIDNDGLIDLYVGNDINPNFLFRNRGDGTFEDLTDLAGAAVDFSGQPQAGMGVDVADIDRDGFVEIFVTNYEAEHNAFYQNLGNNIFQDASQSTGLAAPSMKWVGWGTRFADFDLDGWTDLVITNGHTDNNLHEMGRDAVYEQPPLLFRNDDGRLAPIRAPEGSYFQTRHAGRALVVANLDADAAPDIVMGHKDQSPAILRNASVSDRGQRILVLKFIGTYSNRDGIGIGVEVVGSDPLIREQVKAGGSYLSSQPYSLTLCLPAGESGELKIRWPGGDVQHATLPSKSGDYTIVEGRGTLILNATYQ